MAKLYYCAKCRRVEKSSTKCDFCDSDNVKFLKIGAPVNVIGTKQKGKIFKIKENEVKLIIINANKERVIKEYKPEELQKVL